MLAISRRLHMGCGETLQSRLLGNFQRLALVPESKPSQPAAPTRLNGTGKENTASE